MLKGVSNFVEKKHLNDNISNSVCLVHSLAKVARLSKSWVLAIPAMPWLG